VNRGEIYRYLTKPWDPDQLCSVLHQACAHYQAAVDRFRLLIDLRDYLAQEQPTGEGDAAHRAEEGKELLGRLEGVLSRR